MGKCDSGCQPDWHKDGCAIYLPDDDIKDKIERSSLGTPEAQAARASVSDETAARIVARARAMEAADHDTAPGQAGLEEGPLVERLDAVLARLDRPVSGACPLCGGVETFMASHDGGCIEPLLNEVRTALAARATAPGVEAAKGTFVDERDPACIEAWPECVDGEYDPRCCRFPKSCSAGPHYYEPAPDPRIVRGHAVGGGGT